MSVGATLSAAPIVSNNFLPGSFDGGIGGISMGKTENRSQDLNISL